MCEICNRIDKIKNNAEPYFIKEYITGYLSLFDNQAYEGYCLFIHKAHIEEIHQLQSNVYFEELKEIGKKIEQLYKPLKMNYCILGNGTKHLHCHIIPNNEGQKTIWHNYAYREKFDYNISEIVEKIRGVL